MFSGVRGLASVAQSTRRRGSPYELLPSLACEHPWAFLPGGILADVHSVSALEIGHPMHLGIRMKSKYLAEDAQATGGG